MRIHTDNLTEQAINIAMYQEQKAGRIPLHVHMTVREHRSQSHARAFEVKLSASRKEQGDGRRPANSGYNGAADGYAPTYDEWGWLLAAIYKLDDKAVVGGVKYPTYADREDFEEKTGLTYFPHKLIAVMEEWQRYNNLHGITDTVDPYPFYVSSTGGQAGGVGRGRSQGENLPRYVYADAIAKPGKLSHRWARYAPRTVEFVRQFAKLNAVTA